MTGRTEGFVKPREKGSFMERRVSGGDPTLDVGEFERYVKDSEERGMVMPAIFYMGPIPSEVYSRSEDNKK